MKPEGYNLTTTGKPKYSMMQKFEALDLVKPTRSAIFLSGSTKKNLDTEPIKEGSTMRVQLLSIQFCLGF